MRWIVTVLVAAAPMLAGRAEAQPAPWQPPRMTAGWVFTPALALRGLWDSNITVRNQGNDTYIQGLVGVVNPRGELDYNGRKLRFSTGYSGAFEAYQDVSELNRYEQRGRMSAQYRASQRLQADAGANYTVVPSTDRLELIAGTLPYLNVGGRTFDAGGGFALRTAPRTQLAGRYEYQHIDFDDDSSPVPGRFLAGGYSHGPLVTLQQSLSRRFGVGAEWQYRASVIDGGLQHFAVQTTMGQMSYQVAENTSVSGAAGAAYLDQGDGPSDWGPSYRLGLHHQLGRSSVSINYNRTYVPSYTAVGLNGSEAFAASVYVPLTRGERMAYSGKVSYTTTHPVDAFGGVGFLDSFLTSSSISYQISPWLRTEAFLVTSHQESTGRGNFDRTRIGIQFATFKPLRIQ